MIEVQTICFNLKGLMKVLQRLFRNYNFFKAKKMDDVGFPTIKEPVRYYHITYQITINVKN